MDITLTLRHLRQGPRKVRLATDLIKGLLVDDAKVQLSLLNKRATKPLLKFLESAVATAKNNYQLKEPFYVKNAYVNAGLTLKRFDQRAFGRAYVMRKRASHVTLVLTDQPINKKK
ncbi:MAG: 50S ribosomal protein L22 [bacterium]